MGRKSRYQNRYTFSVVEEKALFDLLKLICQRKGIDINDAMRELIHDYTEKNKHILHAEKDLTHFFGKEAIVETEGKRDCILSLDLNKTPDRNAITKFAESLDLLQANRMGYYGRIVSSVGDARHDEIELMEKLERKKQQ